MNIKHYDDIILYSQMPVASQKEMQETDYVQYRHLLGIYRALYLFETFGHKGNIYILENYTPAEWTSHGGKVYGFSNIDALKSGQIADSQEENDGFGYKIQPEKVKTFKEIKDYQNMLSYKEQNKHLQTSSFSIYQENTPIVIDSRPWVMRKAMGEIPRVNNCVSFLDLFKKDPGSGAKVIKSNEDL